MNKQKLRKAVFPVAGLGTRFLPATKAMPKELLPVLDKPLIQYAVEEAIEAGIDTLIFVTGRNKRAIEDHFDSNLELEAALREKGKNDKADMVNKILPKGVECLFVRQPEQLGLGHAIMCAKRALGSEPFAVLLADDFLLPAKKGVLADLLESYYASGKMQLSVMEVVGQDISNYGVVEYDKKTNEVIGLVEKPKFENAPSNRASIGRYILTDEIFDSLKVVGVGSGGEIQLADAINLEAKKKNVESNDLKIKRFDCGSISGYVEAISETAKIRGYK